MDTNFISTLDFCTDVFLWDRYHTDFINLSPFDNEHIRTKQKYVLNNTCVIVLTKATQLLITATMK